MSRDVAKLVDRLVSSDLGQHQLDVWLEEALEEDPGQLVAALMGRASEIADAHLSLVGFFLAKSEYTSTFQAEAYDELLGIAIERPRSLNDSMIAGLLGSLHMAVNTATLSEPIRQIVGRGLLRYRGLQHAAMTALEILGSQHVQDDGTLGGRLVRVGLLLESSDEAKRSATGELSLSQICDNTDSGRVVNNLLQLPPGAWASSQHRLAWLDEAMKVEPLEVVEAAVPAIPKMTESNFVFVAATLARSPERSAFANGLRCELLNHSTAKPDALIGEGLPIMIDVITRGGRDLVSTADQGTVNNMALLVGRGLAATSHVAEKTRTLTSSLRVEDAATLDTAEGLGAQLLATGLELSEFDAKPTS